MRAPVARRCATPRGRDRIAPCLPPRSRGRTRLQCSRTVLMDASAHPYRSVLYMPGSKPRALEKARSLPADALILDLEDAVAPAEKPRARELVAEAVAAGGYGGRKLIVRINGLDTEWGADDLARACAAAPDAILLPKVERPPTSRAPPSCIDRHGAGAHPDLGDDGDPARHAERRRHRGRPPPARGLRARHQRPRQGPRRGAHARPRCRWSPASASACWPRAPRGWSASTASTTPSRTRRACAPPASRAATWASTARP